MLTVYVYFVPKFFNIEPGLLELLLGVQFFLDAM